jgi:hypothetical protein
MDVTHPKVVSLLSALNVLRGGLPATTAYIQLLKSRIGQPPSLCCFIRLAPNRFGRMIPQTVIILNFD